MPRVPRFGRRRALANRAVDDNVDAAGALVAEATKGAAHGLHSRAPRVLRRVFRPRGVGFEPEERRARVARAYRVAEVAVDALAKHVRRGKCAEMWRLALRAARRATRDVDEKSDAMRSSDSESDDSESEDVSLSSRFARRAPSPSSPPPSKCTTARAWKRTVPSSSSSLTTRFPRWRARRDPPRCPPRMWASWRRRRTVCASPSSPRTINAPAPARVPDAAATAAGSWESAVVHAPPPPCSRSSGRFANARWTDRRRRRARSSPRSPPPPRADPPARRRMGRRRRRRTVRRRRGRRRHAPRRRVRRVTRKVRRERRQSDDRRGVARRRRRRRREMPPRRKRRRKEEKDKDEKREIVPNGRARATSMGALARVAALRAGERGEGGDGGCHRVVARHFGARRVRRVRRGRGPDSGRLRRVGRRARRANEVPTRCRRGGGCRP